MQNEEQNLRIGYLVVVFEVAIWAWRAKLAHYTDVRVTKACEVSEREKVMCFHVNPFFLSCTCELLVNKKMTPFSCSYM